MNLSYRYRNFEFIATWLNPIGEYRGQEIEKRGPIAWSKTVFVPRLRAQCQSGSITKLTGAANAMA